MMFAFTHLHPLQKIASGLMAAMVLLTFVGANLHAVLWQSSEWLVSTVLPAVVVDLTNTERAANAAPPLQRNATLDAAAKLKAEHMAKNEYFSHYSPEGVSPWHWFDRAGYVYAHAGENLAIHFTDSEEVVKAWMESPTHRKNIVDGKFSEIGVGTAKGSYEGYDTVYVVQLFGAPAVPPVPTPAPTPQPAAVPVVVPVPEPVPPAPATDPVLAQTPSPAPDANLTTPTAPVREVVIADVAPSAPSLPEAASEVATLPVVSGESVPDLITEVPTQQPAVETVSSTPAVVSAPAAPLRTPDETAPTPPASADALADIVFLESPVISTSSGLAVAQITTEQPHAGYTLAAVATQPNKLLQFLYMVIGTIALLLISTSIFIEARRLQYRQVVYGCVMLCMMSGSWLFHAWLTGGAVIV